jgi:hypothetical protein
MAVQRLAKLGLTPFAMLQDNVTISRELARQGMGFLERNSSLFSGYFQGAEGSAKREVAELLHTGILGRLRGVTARFDVADARAGTMAKLENTFFKITGITAMTENKRADAERMMASTWASSAARLRRARRRRDAHAAELRHRRSRMGAAAQGRLERDRGRDLSDARRRDKALDADVQAYLKGRARSPSARRPRRRHRRQRRRRSAIERARGRISR